VKSRNDFQTKGASLATGTNPSNAQRVTANRRPEGRRASLFCDHCKRTGHTADKCCKLPGYPSNRQGGRVKTIRGANNAWGDQETQTESTAAISNNTLLPRLNQEQSKQLLQFLTNLIGGGDQKQVVPEATAFTALVHMADITHVFNAIHSFCALTRGTWILDSGASEHMSSKSSFLHDLSRLEYPMMINLPDGTQVEVTHKGKLRVTDGLILNNVLLVPEFKLNLLSIKRLCEQLHSTIQFTDSMCILQAPSQRRPLVIGRDHKGLYILDKRLLETAANSGKQFKAGQFNSCNHIFSMVLSISGIKDLDTCFVIKCKLYLMFVFHLMQ